jgi:hypothetical protein
MVASDPHDKEPRSRVEREVLEILEKAEREPPPITDLALWRAQSAGRRRKAQARAAVATLRGRLTPGIVLLLGLGFAFLAFSTRHGTPGVSRLFALLALVCLIAPFIMAWRRPAPPPTMQRWRGRDIALGQNPDDPLERVRRWWRSRMP